MRSQSNEDDDEARRRKKHLRLFFLVTKLVSTTREGCIVIIPQINIYCPKRSVVVRQQCNARRPCCKAKSNAKQHEHTNERRSWCSLCENDALRPRFSKRPFRPSPSARCEKFDPFGEATICLCERTKLLPSLRLSSWLTATPCLGVCVGQGAHYTSWACTG